MDLDAWVQYAALATGTSAMALLGLATWSRSLRGQVGLRSRDDTAAERQALHAHILSRVTDAIVLVDPSSRVHAWNAGAERLFGHAAAEAVGRPVSEVIVFTGMTTADGKFAAAIPGVGEWRGDAEVVRAGGGTMFVEATVQPLDGEKGVSGWHLVIAHDVDARRRAEIGALARAQQQAGVATLGQQALAGMPFPQLIEQAVTLVADTLQIPAVAVCQVVDHQTALLVRASTGWAKAPPGTRLANDPSHYPACLLAQHGGAALAVGPAAGRPATHPAFERQSISNVRAVVIPCRPIAFGVLVAGARSDRTFGPDDIHFIQAVGNVVGAACERDVMDHELRAELSLYSATLESTAEGILVTDATGRVSRYNRRMIEMWGCPAEVVASERIEDWLNYSMSLADQPELHAAGYRRASVSDHVDSAVITLKDGRVFERQSQPQRVDGVIVGRVWSYRDISERARAEEDRRVHETQMQHVQKLESLGVLAGGIAHDFNNLLVSMMGNAALAMTDVPPESPAHERLVQIEIAAQRAAELTGQMLAYSGKGRFVIERADLSRLVEELVTLLRAAVARTAVLDMSLARDLPAFDGDPAQIRQVIMNLITNAADAIGDAAGRIQITTGVMHATRGYLSGACVGRDLPEGDFVFAEVTDDGCGMDRETLERMFDPFFTTKFTGRGLGLAAVLGIVRGHHGAIKLQSTPGSGTSFRVLLPAAASPAPAAVHTRPEPGKVTETRVLIVDDEEAVRRIAGESLRRAGFDVTVVADGEEAVAVVRRGDVRFDAVLLDMTMPRMSGVETCHMLKELMPKLPVVLTSGYSKEDASSRFAAGTIAGFIQKPFLPATLVRVMHEAVRRQPVEEPAR